ncbi:hypothetical protein GOBAR_AA06286 [Gossypium barbadense]|uniref:Uncharacterized protein n=1 Tax=Gossypium barbadense TaxID=3634 RepID=A0A2P5YFB2_GOSBA|nr:hypothetical protein GOBAR_AA06286 [Gossypium barbadense]
MEEVNGYTSWGRKDRMKAWVRGWYGLGAKMEQRVEVRVVLVCEGKVRMGSWGASGGEKGRHEERRGSSGEARGVGQVGAARGKGKEWLLTGG